MVVREGKAQITLNFFTTTGGLSMIGALPSGVSTKVKHLQGSK